MTLKSRSSVLLSVPRLPSPIEHEAHRARSSLVRPIGSTDVRASCTLARVEHVAPSPRSTRSMPAGCSEFGPFLPGGTKNAFSLAEAPTRAEPSDDQRPPHSREILALAMMRAHARHGWIFQRAVAVTPAFPPGSPSVFSKHLKKNEESPVGAGPKVRDGARMIWGCFVEAPQKECGWRTAKVASEPSES
jgi:hypothetical protein